MAIFVTVLAALWFFPGVLVLLLNTPEILSDNPQTDTAQAQLLWQVWWAVWLILIVAALLTWWKSRPCSEQTGATLRRHEIIFDRPTWHVASGEGPSGRQHRLGEQDRPVGERQALVGPGGRWAALAFAVGFGSELVASGTWMFWLASRQRRWSWGPSPLSPRSWRACAPRASLAGAATSSVWQAAWRPS